MALKRDKLDAVFSDLVRGRAGWKSELSGQTESLQCCHIYSRKFISTRWHPMNAVCLTASEHARFTDRPVAFTDWLRAKFGWDYLFNLALLANTHQKFTPREREGLYQHYKQELDMMESVRASMEADGETGRIEFSWPDPIPEATPKKRAKAKRLGKFKKKLNGQVVLRDGSNLNKSRAA